MGDKPTHGQLEKRIRALEQKALDGERAKQALQQSLREISFLNALGYQLSRHLSFDQVVQSALDGIFQLIRIDMALLFIRERDKLFLKGHKFRNEKYRLQDTGTHKVGECLCGMAVSERRAIFSIDIQNDPKCTWRECKKAGLVSFAALPLRSGEEILGVLGLASADKYNYGEQSALLEAASNAISIGMQNYLHYRQLEDHTIKLEQEIVERERLQAQLIQAQKMEALGTLTGGIAHDFNNILAAIVGYADLALADANKGSLQHDNLQQLLKAGNRAKDLVQQILTFSRHVEQIQEPLHIQPIITEALKLLRASMPATIAIDQNLESDEAWVMGNATQIHQIIMNLGTNAAQAMAAQGGMLSVSLSSVKIDPEGSINYPGLISGPYIQLTVTDTGHGMPAKVKEKIFDPFFTTKEKGSGTGLGLSVVHGIVKSHGGAIYVDAERGKGATFNVLLPYSEKRPPPEGETAKPIPTGKERILFVDDESTIANMSQQMLASLGYNVTIMTSSIEALALFKTNPDGFDLVITDMTMPQMTGEKLARALLQIKPGIPVILSTGFSTKMDEKKALAMGIHAFIAKPINKREIAEVIRAVLDAKR